MTGNLSDMTPAFMEKVRGAQKNLKAIAYLSIMGGVFSLFFMLLMASRQGEAFVNITNVSFLTGGAVAFALGVGLLNNSEAARAAGTAWFLVWGIFQMIVGFFSAAYLLEVPTGIFCIVGGVAQIVFADILHLPAEVFLTAYCGGSVEPRNLEEGLMKAAAESNHTVNNFIAKHHPPADGA